MAVPNHNSLYFSVFYVSFADAAHEARQKTDDAAHSPAKPRIKPRLARFLQINGRPFWTKGDG
ncbi:MAG: hypothetical protein ACREB0_05080, partial [Sphingopyxis sp.]